MSDTCPVITIDGPSGSGKGTISQLLAMDLGWNLLDSGALYRVLAMAAYQHSVAIENEAALEVLAGHLDVQFQATEGQAPTRIILEGSDVTDVIRTEQWGNAASQVGALPAVRLALLERQRAFRDWPGLIADGRDMGTVVFPDAQFKLFLVASREERANRRYNQLKEKGINVNLEQIVEEIIERDERDSERDVAPSKPAPDALQVDTTGLSIDNVYKNVRREVEKRFAEELVPSDLI